VHMGCMIVPSKISVDLSFSLSCCMRPVFWIGFYNATDRQKLQAFLNRCKRSGFCDSEIDDFATLRSTADKHLFSGILNHPEQVLHSLLPHPSASLTTFVTDHTNRLLCQRASRLTDCNFIIRMLCLLACLLACGSPSISTKTLH